MAPTDQVHVAKSPLLPIFKRLWRNWWRALERSRRPRSTPSNPHPLSERYFHDPKWMCPRYFKEYFLRLLAIEGVFQNLGSS
jgi:hypothetical protein